MSPSAIVCSTSPSLATTRRAPVISQIRVVLSFLLVMNVVNLAVCDKRLAATSPLSPSQQRSGYIISTLLPLTLAHRVGRRPVLSYSLETVAKDPLEEGDHRRISLHDLINKLQPSWTGCLRIIIERHDPREVVLASGRSQDATASQACHSHVNSMGCWFKTGQPALHVFLNTERRTIASIPFACFVSVSMPHQGFLTKLSSSSSSTRAPSTSTEYH